MSFLNEFLSICSTDIHTYVYIYRERDIYVYVFNIFIYIYLYICTFLLNSENVHTDKSLQIYMGNSIVHVTFYFMNTHLISRVHDQFPSNY